MSPAVYGFMKAKMVLIASVVVLTSPLVGADPVDPAKLPPAVQKSLEMAGEGSAVQKITTRTVDGRTVYDIELKKKNAPNPRLRIAEDGQVLRDPPLTAGDVPMALGDGVAVPPAEPRLKLEELPGAAQETVRRLAAGREIAAINAERIDEHDGYAVQFREAGRNPWVYIAADGAVLRPTEKPPALLIGTTFGDTPAAVQQAIRREAGEAEIVKIDKDASRNSVPSYRVELRSSRGTFHLRLSETGDVLENTRDANRAKNRG